MRKDKKVEIGIRDLNKMTKAEVQEVIRWIRSRATKLEMAVKLGQPWLVKRKNYGPLFRFGLIK